MQSASRDLPGVRGTAPTGALRGRVGGASTRALSAFLVALVSLGVLAPTAAASYGHGLYGGTTDKVVTYAGFSLIVFFPVFVFVMSTIQGRLERRKDARKAAARLSMANGRWRGGW